MVLTEAWSFGIFFTQGLQGEWRESEERGGEVTDEGMGA